MKPDTTLIISGLIVLIIIGAAVLSFQIHEYREHKAQEKLVVYNVLRIESNNSAEDMVSALNAGTLTQGVYVGHEIRNVLPRELGELKK